MLPSIVYTDGYDKKVNRKYDDEVEEDGEGEGERDEDEDRTKPRKSLERSAKRSAHRANPSKALYKQALDILGKQEIYPVYNILSHHLASDFSWSSLPWSVSVEGGILPHERCWRKVIQVENLLFPSFLLLMHALKKKLMDKTVTDVIRCVEFCAGSGFVILPLAAFFAIRYPEFLSHVEFILLDRKGRSIEIARERVAASGLSSLVQVREECIEDFNEPFHIGIALHACGGASDVSLEKCVAAKAAFVVCSCCIGKIPFYRSKPLSKKFKSSLLNDQGGLSFLSLIKAADFGHADVATYSANDQARRMCKAYVEADRCCFAEEHGYKTILLLMTNILASPKNDIICGYPLATADNERLQHQKRKGKWNPFHDFIFDYDTIDHAFLNMHLTSNL